MAKEKSYDDYFDEFYGSGPSTETEPEEEEVEQEQETSDDLEELEQEVEGSDEDQEEEGEEAPEKEEDEYETLLDSVDDPDLKKKIQQLVQSDKSQKGRVSALTKKLNKLEEYYNNAVSQAPAQASAPTGSSDASASTAPEKRAVKEEEEELSPEMAALKEKAPAVYSAMEKMAEAKSKKELEEARQEYEQRIKPLEESYKREANQREAHRLEEMASETFNTDETGISVRDVITSNDFAAWLRGQPQRVRDIYRNASTADEAMLVLNKFENDYQYMKKINDELNQEEATPRQERKKDSSAKGDELKQKRDKVKKKTVSPKSKSAATSAVDSTDYDNLFDHFWGESGIYRTQRRHG